MFQNVQMQPGVTILTNDEKNHVKAALANLVNSNRLNRAVADGFTTAMQGPNLQPQFTAFFRQNAGSSYNMQTVENIVLTFCNSMAQQLHQVGMAAAAQMQQQYMAQPQTTMVYGMQAPSAPLLGAPHLPTSTVVPPPPPLTPNQSVVIPQSTIATTATPNEFVVAENVSEYEVCMADDTARLSAQIKNSVSPARIVVRSMHQMAFTKRSQMALLSIESPVSGATEALSYAHAALVNSTGSAHVPPFAHVVRYHTVTPIGLSVDNLKLIRGNLNGRGVRPMPCRAGIVPDYQWMINSWGIIKESLEVIRTGEMHLFERMLFNLVARKNNYDVRLLNDPEQTSFPTTFDNITNDLQKQINEKNPVLTAAKFSQYYFFNLFDILSAIIPDGDTEGRLIWAQKEEPPEPLLLPKVNPDDPNEKPRYQHDHNAEGIIQNHADIISAYGLDPTMVYWREPEFVMLTNLPSAIANKKRMRFTVPMDAPAMSRTIPHVMDSLIVWYTILCEQYGVIPKDDFYKLIALRKIALCDTDLRDGYITYDLCRSAFVADSKIPLFLDVARS